MAKTLDDGFETFLGWLVPLESEHHTAARHKSSVKSCLENNFDCYNFFETGSFGHGTGVRHYSDTDYFAVCKTASLKENSAVTLREVKSALQDTFWNTIGIEVKTPAVRVPFGKYKSENLEVTPCDYQGLIETPLGKKATYDIPAYDGSWMRSSPDAHNAYVKKHDDRLSGKLKPLIQLVKAWKFYNNVPIRSFYLELRITKYAEAESTIIYDIDLKRIMRLMDDNELASIRDPMGISGMIGACATDVKKRDALSKLSTGVSRAEKAVEQRDKDLNKAFYWWDMFFDGGFPAR
jgi:hypothetical protein